MSIHSSLRISGQLRGVRNVWTRAERLAALKKEGRWSDGDSVLGLPKVRTHFKVKTKKQLKAEAAQPKDEDTGAGEDTTAGVETPAKPAE